jgi:hypothetical protein
MDTASRNKDIRFIMLLVLLHAIAFLLASHYTRIYMGDSQEYIYEAINIKKSFFFYSGAPALPVTAEYMTQRQPLYPLFLLLVYTFTVNNWIVLLLQNILSILNIWIARKLFLRLGYNRRYDPVLLLFLIAYPAQFIYANTVAPDILLQSFVLLYVYYFVLLVKEKKGRYAFYMSLALIAGLFVKPVLYPFSAVHIIILLIFARHQRQAFRDMLLASFLPICAVLLYNTWNYERTGKFHFSSNQAFNAIYYYYQFEVSQYGTKKASAFLHDERARIAAMPTFKERYDYANARGTALLKGHFLPYTEFHLKNSLRFFVEPGKGEIDLFTGKLTYGTLYSGKGEGFYSTWKEKGMAGMGAYFRNNPSMILVIIVLLFNVLKIVLVILFLFNKRIPTVFRLFLFIFMCYFAITTGPIANTRYFLPLSLLVCGCAAMIWQVIQDNRSKASSQNRGAH